MRSSKGKELVTLSGVIVRRTDRAVLMRFGDQEAWMPLSQCEVIPGQGSRAEIHAPRWLVEEKGLEDQVE